MIKHKIDFVAVRMRKKSITAKKRETPEGIRKKLKPTKNGNEE